MADTAKMIRMSSGGVLGLIDGLRGSTTFTDGRWQGFEGKDLIATIDLGSLQAIHTIKVGFLQDIGVWIFPPTSIQFEASEDGEHYLALPALKQPTVQADAPVDILEVSLEQEMKARYIRVKAQNIGTCPDWHSGAGGKAWLFVDEIVVE